MSSKARPLDERYVSTSTGIGIGRCHVRQPLARVAGSVSGPHRRRSVGDIAVQVACGIATAFVCALLVWERLA